MAAGAEDRRDQAEGLSSDANDAYLNRALIKLATHPGGCPLLKESQALSLVLRFRDDFENDGLYVAYVHLTFAGHSCPTLTAVHFVRPGKRWVVLTHPAKSVAVRAKSVDHAAC